MFKSFPVILLEYIIDILMACLFKVCLWKVLNLQVAKNSRMIRTKKKLFWCIQKFQIRKILGIEHKFIAWHYT